METKNLVCAECKKELGSRYGNCWLFDYDSNHKKKLRIDPEILKNAFGENKNCCSEKCLYIKSFKGFPEQSCYTGVDEEFYMLEEELDPYDDWWQDRVTLREIALDILFEEEPHNYRDKDKIERFYSCPENSECVNYRHLTLEKAADEMFGNIPAELHGSFADAVTNQILSHEAKTFTCGGTNPSKLHKDLLAAMLARKSK